MIWQCGRFSFDLSGKAQTPWVMGILNVTPDSFSDGGQHAVLEIAVNQALNRVKEGAHIIDVGGESTRPNHTPVAAHDEIKRVVPVIHELVAQDLCVSIDTHKPCVMQAALSAGAAIVNDVNALDNDESLQVIRDSQCGVVVMDGFSANDQRLKQAGVGLMARLSRRYSTLIAAGIAPARIVIDPGIGFNKTYTDNVACITLLPEMKRIAPVLIGISRKSVLGTITGQTVDKRLAASLAAALMAAQQGAAILRVHDVEQTCDALAVWRALS